MGIAADVGLGVKESGTTTWTPARGWRTGVILETGTGQNFLGWAVWSGFRDGKAGTLELRLENGGTLRLFRVVDPSGERRAAECDPIEEMAREYLEEMDTLVEDEDEVTLDDRPRRGWR